MKCVGVGEMNRNLFLRMTKCLEKNRKRNGDSTIAESPSSKLTLSYT